MSPSIETNGYGSLFPVTLRNNLFLAGSLNFNDYNNYCFYQDIAVADNLFVQCAFSYYSDLGYGPRNISYNGWYQTTALHGSAPSGSGACGAYGPAVNGGDVLLTNLDFQTGPLGNYYYPPGGTNLARLIDAGDMSASAAGLTNYTTQLNSTPDTGLVDIGFHYETYLGLSAQCRSDHVELLWNVPDWLEQSYYIDGFNLYRANSAAGPYVLINAGYDSSQRMYVDSSVTPGTTYYYKVTFTYYDYVTGLTFESPFSNVAAISTCPVPYGGPTDVAFIIDNTSSMSDSLSAITNAIGAILNDILASSSNDCRLALVTPDLDNDGGDAYDYNCHDMVDVRLSFTNSLNAFTNVLNSIQIGNGDHTPESTDQCLNTVVNALIAAGRTNDDVCPPASPVLQTNNFTGFRTNARKLVVLITDAPPSGFCDSYPPTASDAHQYAVEANGQCIKINAIQMNDDGDATPIMQDYAATSCGWYSQVLDYSDTAGIENAIVTMLYEAGECNCP
jgi:hypothetical protein